MIARINPAVAASLVAAGLSICWTPVLAQNASAAPSRDGDWTLAELPERKATLAVAEFSSGLGIVVRCVDRTFDVLIDGLPSAPGQDLSREIGLVVGEDGEEDTTVWTVGADRTSAFSRLPARVARQLAKGGKLQVIVPGAPGERRTRYEMALDPSGQAIEHTLGACGRPLVDTRDYEARGNGQDGLPSPVTWARMPQPNFPMVPGVAGEGVVTMSCVVQDDGRLEDCLIESEHPGGHFFGRSVERSLGRARLKVEEEAAANGLSLEDRFVVFTVKFRLAS